MYGETPMAKSEKRFKAPPPKVFNKPKRPLSAKVLIAETRTPEREKDATTRIFIRKCIFNKGKH